MGITPDLNSDLKAPIIPKHIHLPVTFVIYYFFSLLRKSIIEAKEISVQNEKGGFFIRLQEVFKPGVLESRRNEIKERFQKEIDKIDNTLNLINKELIPGDISIFLNGQNIPVNLIAKFI